MNFYNPVTWGMIGFFLGFGLEWIYDHFFWRPGPDTAVQVAPPSELEAELAETRGKHQEASRLLASKQIELENANARVKALEEQTVPSAEVPDGEFSALRTKYSELQAKHDALLTSQRTDSAAASEDFQRLQEKYAALQTEHQALKDKPVPGVDPNTVSELTALQAAHTDLKRRYDEMAAEKIKVSAAEQEALRKAHEELSQASRSEQAHSAEFESLKNEHRALLKVRDELKAELDKAHQELKARPVAVAPLSAAVPEPKLAEPKLAEPKLGEPSVPELKVEPAPQPAPSSPEPKEVPTQVEVAPPSGNARRDPFQKIEGIGPIFERRLWEAGILTFAQLAGTTASEVEEIIQPEKWQKIEPAIWLKEAGEFARGERQ